MLHFQALGFDFQKRLAARQFFGGIVFGVRGQADFGVGQDFFNKVFHAGRILAGKRQQGKRSGAGRENSNFTIQNPRKWRGQNPSYKAATGIGREGGKPWCAKMAHSDGRQAIPFRLVISSLLPELVRHRRVGGDGGPPTVAGSDGNHIAQAGRESRRVAQVYLSRAVILPFFLGGGHKTGRAAPALIGTPATLQLPSSSILVSSTPFTHTSKSNRGFVCYRTLSVISAVSNPGGTFVKKDVDTFVHAVAVCVNSNIQPLSNPPTVPVIVGSGFRQVALRQ